MARRVTPPLAVEDTETLDLHLNGGVISGDLASGAVGEHDHDDDYVNVVGDTMTGPLAIDVATNWAPLGLDGATEGGTLDFYKNGVYQGSLYTDTANRLILCGSTVEFIHMLQGTPNLLALNPYTDPTDILMRGEIDIHLFYADASTDRVGIGTNTPSQKLHVVGNALLSQDLYLRDLFGGAATLTWGLIVNEDGHYATIRFETPNDPNIFFTDVNTDRVGIGTATPAQKLHVSGNALISGLAGTGTRVVTASSTGVLGAAGTGSSNTQVIFNDGGALVGDPGLTYELATDKLTVVGAGVFGWGLSINEGAHFSDTRIKSNSDPDLFVANGTTNRIGIGTAAPSTKLHVAGNTLISDLAGTGTRMVTADSTGLLATAALPAASVAGSDTQVIFNDGGAYAGDSGLTYAKSTDTLTAGTHTALVLKASGNVPNLFFDETDAPTDEKFWRLAPNGGDLWLETVSDSFGVARTVLRFARTGTLVTNIVFNDAQADTDFQVKSDLADYALYVDASTDRVGIGTNTPSQKLDVVGGGLFTQNGNNLILSSSTATGLAHLWYQDAGTGKWAVYKDDNNNLAIYDAVSGQSPLYFQNGSTGIVHINTGGEARDLQVHGDIDPYLLYTDASTDRVGIGTSTPGAKLQVAGAVIVDSTTILSSLAGSGTRMVTTDASGVLSSAAIPGGGSGSPGGSTTQVQFNDAGAFGGDAGLTYNKTTDALTVAGGDPLYLLRETDAAADEKVWALTSNSGILALQLKDDAETTATNILRVHRVGYNPDYVQVETFLVANTGLIVNQSGGDWDLQVKGDTDANLLYTDASADRVGVGTASPDAKLDIANVPDGLFGLNIRGSSVVSGIKFASSTNTQWANIYATSGYLTLADASSVEHLNVSTTQTIINPSGNDLDTQIKGDIDPNLVYVDASTDRVGIGTNLPSQKLEVVGQIKATNFGNALWLNGGSATSATSIVMARNTTKELEFGLAGSAGDWSSDSAAGDVVLRSSAGNILFNANGGFGNADLKVAAAGVTVDGLTGTGTRPVGASSAGLLAPLAYGTTSGTVSEGNHTHTATYTLAIPIGDGTNVIPTGVYTDFQMPVAGTFVAWRILATKFTSGSTGSVVFDLWKSAYSAFPPVVGGSISTSKPTLTTAAKAEDTTITDWTEAFSAGDCFRLNVDSSALLTLCTLILEYTRAV